MEDQQRKNLISVEIERFDRLIAPLYAEIDARIARDLPEEFEDTCALMDRSFEMFRQHCKEMELTEEQIKAIEA